MANIKKTFNFRNGVQVDDDNLIVNATGLVGIGTTIPTEALDVRGTANIVGLITATTGNIGVLTVTTVDIVGQQTISGGLVGSGVSIKSGVITATDPTGIVTFYGDARYLQGMPTSQWLDKDVGLGYSSIYNAGGNVGIHTNDPRYGLQIGGNNDIDNFANGVGINTTGSIFATGIITATSFVGAIAGPVTGNVVGNVTGNLNSTGVSTIGSLKITNINITGLSTHRVPFTDATDNIVDSDDLTFNNNSNVLNIVGTTDTDQLNVSGVSTLGVSTFTSTVSFGATSSFNDNSKLRFGDGGDLKLYHNGTRSYVQDDISGDLRICSNDIRFRSSDDGTTSFYVDHNGETQLYHNTNIKLKTSGVGVTVYNQLDTTNIVASGVITATTELNSPLVGVGTDNPATDIQVRKSGAAQMRVTSDTDAAIVSIGREPSSGNGNNAALRYGNNSIAFPYSNPDALDIINYDTGNINFYLGANAAGDFHWHKGPNSTRLMTLTNGGKLGIGITLPLHPLHVSGISTFTGNSFFGNNVEIGNNLTIKNNLIVDGSFNSDVTGNLTGNVTGNINSVGLSTLYDAKVTRFLGIGVEASTGVPFKVNASADTQFSIDTQGDVRVGHDLIVGVGNSIVVGGPSVSSGVDFKDAGGVTRRFMVPPTVSTAERNSLVDLVAGAMVWNSQLSRIELWDGTEWRYVQNAAI